MRVIQIIIIIIINNLLSVELTITSPKQCDSNSRQLIWSQFSSANSAWRLHYLISKAHRAAGPTKPIILPRMENECWLNPGLTNRVINNDSSAHQLPLVVWPPTKHQRSTVTPMSTNSMKPYGLQWRVSLSLPIPDDKELTQAKFKIVMSFITYIAKRI